jgi:hypothetical protein
MRMITACFARALKGWMSRICVHFLLTFQEVMPISKTRNQLAILAYKPIKLLDDPIPTLLPLSQPAIIYASNLRQVAQHLHSRTSTEIPTRHLPLTIEMYQESKPCQHLITTPNNPPMPLPC